MSNNYTQFQLKCIAFNNNQTETGVPLQTLKGSVIQRSKFGMGKMMARKLYFHKSYADKLLKDMDAYCLFTLADSKVEFEYNIVKWDSFNLEISLEEVSDFNTAREPRVGKVFVLNRDRSVVRPRSYSSIIHHKWTMVDNTYTDFDVRESWEWSRTWLNLLQATANGTSLQAWEEQLKTINLS